jgi:flagellar biosynthesis protein FlhF
MGSDAVIMASKTDKSTGMVTLTAAIDDDFRGDNNPAAPAAPSFSIPAERDSLSRSPAAINDDDPLDILSDIMENNGVPRRLASRLLRWCDALDTRPVQQQLELLLEQAVRFSSLSLEPGKPVALLGIPGAGKTLTAAKLATRAHLAGTPLNVITTDTHKAGGIEQLESLLRVLGMITHSAPDATSVRTLLNLTRSHGAVLLDTPGINPFEQAAVQELQGLLDGSNCQTLLVLPAGLDAAEAVDIVQAFASAFPVQGVLLSRFDMARRHGAALAVAEQCRLPLLEAGVGSAIPEGLLPLTPALLAQRMLALHHKRNPNHYQSA